MTARHKILIILGIIVFIVVVSFFTIFSNRNKSQSVVRCVNDEEIWKLHSHKSTTKDIDEKSKIIEGFYVSKNSIRLEGWAKRVTEKLELSDFIEGYWPPTPLLGLQQKFQEGDLIKLEIEEYANLSTGETGALASIILVLKVSKAEKLPLPSKSEFLNKAQQVFDANANAIFRCAASKISDFPSFKSVEPNINWDRANQQVYITYQGTKDYFGMVKVVNVGMTLDKNGEPLSVLVSSHVAPLK